MNRRGGLKRLNDTLEQDIAKVLFAAGSIIEDRAKGLIMEGSVSGKGHIPSAPGEPPNNDTSRLHNGIETTQPEPLRVTVTSTAPYSAALEYGTSRMEARPFMMPAAVMTRREVAETVTKGVAAAVRKSGV